MSAILDTIRRDGFSNVSAEPDGPLVEPLQPRRKPALCQCCGELVTDCRTGREMRAPRQLDAALNPPRRIEDSTAELVRRTNRLFDGRTREEIRAAIPEIIKALQALWGDNEDQRIPEYDIL